MLVGAGSRGGRRSRNDCTPSAKSGPAEALDHQVDGVALGGAQPGVQLGVDLPLHHRHRRRRRRPGELADVLLRRRQHLLGRQGPVDQADAVPPRRRRPCAPSTAGRGRGPGRRAGSSSHDMPHSATRPRWANDVVSTAASLMNRRSHGRAIGTPMPATGPLIAAMIGLGTDIRYVYVPRRSSPHDVVARRRRERVGDGIGWSSPGAGQSAAVVHVGAGAEAPSGAGEDDARRRPDRARPARRRRAPRRPSSRSTR